MLRDQRQKRGVDRETSEHPIPVSEGVATLLGKDDSEGLAGLIVKPAAPNEALKITHAERLAVSDASPAKVTLTISRATYEAVLKHLQREGADEAVMPRFVENTLRGWLRSQDYFDRLAKKGTDELTEDELMDLINNEIHTHRDTTLKPKGF